MNSVALLLGILLLAYLGGSWGRSRSIVGGGLPSGVEYWALGVLVSGPVLGVVSQSLLIPFKPLLLAGASWISFLAGLGYTTVGDRSLDWGRACFGVFWAAASAAAIAAALMGVHQRYPLMPEALTLPVALGLASVGASSTRQAVRWVAQRHAAGGPLVDLVADHARSSAVVPMLCLAVFRAHLPGPLSQFASWWRCLFAIGIGAALGLVLLLLLRKSLPRADLPGLVLGAVLLCTGVAARLGVETLTAAFVLGFVLGAVSPRKMELIVLLRPTERAVQLPLAVSAGVLLSGRDYRGLWIAVLVALLVRLIAELLRGGVLALWFPTKRLAAMLSGFGLVATGECSLAAAISLACAAETGIVGGAVALAATHVLVGELLGPWALRRGLERAGELGAGLPDRPSVQPLAEEDEPE